MTRRTSLRDQAQADLATLELRDRLLALVAGETAIIRTPWGEFRVERINGETQGGTSADGPR